MFNIQTTQLGETQHSQHVFRETLIKEHTRYYFCTVSSDVRISRWDIRVRW